MINTIEKAEKTLSGHHLEDFQEFIKRANDRTLPATIHNLSIEVLGKKVVVTYDFKHPTNFSENENDMEKTWISE